ncbi:MAG: hypothetical protein Q8P50_07995 [Bacillota bacterium]|nr:hypothetical protein [Bacillota bacterium]
MHDRNGRIFFALLLIVVGLFFSAITYFPGHVNAEKWWPSFILLPGIAMLGAGIAGRLSGGRSGVGPMAIPGCIVSTVGLILLYANVTNHWEAWAYAWALIPASVGLGIMLAAGLKSGEPGSARAGRWLFVSFMAVFAVFGLFFEGLIFHGTIGRFWPVLLILVGALMLFMQGRGGVE